MTICDVDGCPVRDVAAAMPAAAAARVAASATNLNEQTVVQSRGRSPRSVEFNGFTLRRREAQ